MKINHILPRASTYVKVQIFPQPTHVNRETKLEIERRFWVDHLPKDLHKYPHEDITQGYLSTKEGTSIRLRKIGNIYYQTIKKGTGKIREETEIEISKSIYDLLWEETKGRRLKKTRYEIPHGKRIIELDIYHGKLKGLMTVEVEFESEEECDDFVPPEWFSVEVTGIKDFTNKHLATCGIPHKLLKKLTRKAREN